MLQQTRLFNLECVSIGNRRLTLVITQSTGPRILSLSLDGGENLLAEIPDFTLNCPGGGQLHLWGGHRLWYAPEVAAITYLPDDQPVAVTPLPDGVIVTPPMEAATGLQKEWLIRLPDETATVVIDHRLTNRGAATVTCAPWAITQLKTGGLAILPQAAGPRDAEGLQPNRSLALWPYTDINSPFLQWGHRCVLISAELSAGALKIGFPNPVGWLAYHWRDTLFVKYAAYDPAADYYDFGSSSQCYCNARFLELETLGPRVTLAPGATTWHREVWQVAGNVRFTPMPAAIDAVIAGQLRPIAPYLAWRTD